MTEQVDDGVVAVAVDVAGPVAGPLLRVVEGTLGWPVVEPDDTVLPPRCVLTDPARAAVHAGGPVPVALVTSADDLPATAARAGRSASVVFDGVPGAAELRRALVVLDDRARGPRRGPLCTVVAAAGGVGATTVAACLAGLRAWRHGPTLLAASGPAHTPDAPVLSAADLASPAAWAAAARAVGVRDLRVVRLRPGPAPADPGTTPLVVDRGVVDEPADVLVVRPDRAGQDAVERTATGAVVVVGRGPVDHATLRRAAHGRPVVVCPWSARVAAAAAAGRLPADAPGSWLRELVPVLERLGPADGAASEPSLAAPAGSAGS